MKLNRLAPLALLLALTGCTAADWAEIREYERTHNDCPSYANTVADNPVPPQRARCTTLDFSTNCSITPPPPTRQERYDAALRQCEANR